jgi:plasmid stabilization system protein ParE
LPVLITDAAKLQYRGMIARYLQPTSQRPARPEAARKLIEAYDRAVQEIATNPGNSLTHPRPYPQLSAFGFRWIKIHRYWFGYAPGQSAIITNIFDEAGDMPAHISATEAPAGQA